ncbi:MAG: hypothetical protein AAF704_17130 [Cyanobacteria bacterium P01_D01_bin.123]
MSTGIAKHNYHMLANFFTKAYPYIKRTLKDPRWAIMFVLARLRVSYPLIAFLLNQLRRNETSYTNEGSLFQNLDVDLAVKALKQDGCSLGLELPPDVLAEILSYAEAANCYGEQDPRYGFRYAKREEAEKFYGKEFMRGEYLNTVSECPAIAKLARDPKLYEIARKYFGVKPVFMSTRMWWNFDIGDADRDLSEGARTFHYDVDDYRCLAFFFYLTDVGEREGEHVCAKGSHNRKKFRHYFAFGNRNLPDREISDFYGPENLISIYGKAGQGFVEDKFTYHKATSPSGTDRLILYFQFGVFDYGVNNCVDPQLLSQWEEGSQPELVR